MEEWRKVFKINKELDEIFMDRYLSIEKQYYEKNCVELIVEISELANETKCFKYWTTKKSNKEAVLEEYADTITMILSIFTYLNIEISDKIYNHSKTHDIIVLLNILFKEASSLFETKDSEIAYQIFIDLLYLGELLGFSEKEELDACYKKMDIVRNRLNSDY